MNQGRKNPLGSFAQYTSGRGEPLSKNRGPSAFTYGKVEEKVEAKNGKIEELDCADQVARVDVKPVPTGGNCRHEVAVPAGQYVADCASYASAARQSLLTFPFEPDPFQEEAMKCVESGHSTIVSAPACSGKTLAAKYLIAKAENEHFRIVYTSPHQKLCLRKYRELVDEFPSVSYVSAHTDFATSPWQPVTCLVMTTSTLNQILQRDVTSLDGFGWIAFDEAHLIGDKGVGHLYEETLMLARQGGDRKENRHRRFKLLLLADPIPNVNKLVEWVANLQQTPCHLITPDERPTPQKHFIYTTGSAKGLNLVVNRGHFSAPSFNNALERHLRAMEQRRRSSQGLLFQNGFVSASSSNGVLTEEQLSSHVVKLVRTLHERDKLPCIVFCANESECERIATALAVVDFNSQEEKTLVGKIYENSLDGVAQDTDRSLMQVAGYSHYVLKGVGIHHDGMLPILKDITETLHDAGGIKVLLTVEAFARETKLSARTAIITFSRKCDRCGYRPLTCDEYSLMAGRAGRREKDETGWVVLMLEREMNAEEAERIMAGTPSPISSHFAMNPSLAANMLLSRVDPTSLFKQTFYHYASRAELPKLKQEYNNLGETRRGIHVERESDIESYHAKQLKVADLEREVKARVLVPTYIEPALHETGRMLHIVHNENDYKWGVLVHFQSCPTPADPNQLTYVIDVAVRVASECAVDDSGKPIDLSLVRPPSVGDNGALAILPFTHDCIRGVGGVRLKLPEYLDDPLGRKALEVIIEKTLERLGGNIPEIDPTEEMYRNDPELRTDWNRWRRERDELDNHPVARDLHNFTELYAKYKEKLALKEKEIRCKEEIDRHEGFALTSDYDACYKLFAHYNYIDADHTLNAHKLSAILNFSSVSSAFWALILSQSLINGIFDGLAPSALTALLSCFVSLEERTGIVRTPVELRAPLRRIRETAKSIARDAKSFGLPEVSIPILSGHLMGAVQKWCNGATFAEAIDANELSEGAFAQCLERVDLLLQEMLGTLESLSSWKNYQGLRAVIVVANKELRRGIPFTNSLYLP